MLVLYLLPLILFFFFFFQMTRTLFQARLGVASTTSYGHSFPLETWYALREIQI
uniref:Uncharacterized protein n=1 Tax=Rhizophora mucronata TaxID=61149 RepID=A0A2P2M3E2_RHIMU